MAYVRFDEHGIPSERGATRFPKRRRDGATGPNTFARRPDLPRFGRRPSLPRWYRRIPLPPRLPIPAPLLLAPLVIEYVVSRDPIPWKPHPAIAAKMEVKCRTSQTVDCQNVSGGHVGSGLCGLGNQASTTATSTSTNFVSLPAGTRTVYMFQRTSGTGCGGQTNRYRVSQIWWYTSTTVTPINAPLFEFKPYKYWPSPWYMPNPNDARFAPSDRPHQPEMPKRAEPLPRTVPAQAIGFGSGGASPVAPSTRTPPRRGDKEQKTQSRSGRLMVAFFKVLDQTSESAEIVSAFYDALPPHVRERWEAKRADYLSRQAIDNAGQYGIDGADWKLKAIYHNWHYFKDLDRLETALRGAVWNILEDKVYGGVHKRLPPNWINANEGAEKALADAVKELETLVGLKRDHEERD